MKASQLAAQLYTVRNFLKTPEDIAASLKKVKAIGYDAVQVSGMGPIPEADLVSLCKDLGLVICATHEPSDTILNEPNRVVDRLAALGCRYTAYPHPRNIDFSTVASVTAFAKRLDAAGAVLRAAGQVLTYHNHDTEFQQAEDGRTALQIIYDESSPENLQAELDLHWVARGGGSPTAWITRLSGRQPLIHLKDFRLDSEKKPMFAEIGHGNLDWDTILPAADAAGVEWFIVEQDITPGDPFDSLAMSYRFLRARCA